MGYCRKIEDMIMNKLKVDWNDKISDKKALLVQLTSLREEAVLMMQASNDEVFSKDRTALAIAIHIIKEVI